jgi:pimeloyl-ACP methyl ester carboxylesterase
MVTLSVSSARVERQDVPAYGANRAAGQFVESAGVKVYYERYGSGGRPLLLLHGGIYGYIDEFAALITHFAATRTVIAVSSRGYGPSELGNEPLSHRLLAADAAAVLRHAFPDGRPVDVLGFSQGATVSYLLAAAHPTRVYRLVAIAGALGTYGRPVSVLEQLVPLTPEAVEKQAPEVVAKRKRLLPDPSLWEEMIRRTQNMYSQPVFVRQEDISAIQAATLLMVGDQDRNNPVEHISAIFRLLRRGELMVVPGCGHVVLACKPTLTLEVISRFLAE